MPKKDEFIERQIIIGMIVSTAYLERVVPICKEEYFESDEAAVISKWCTQYFDSYRKAPQLDIELIYDSKAKRLTDKHQKELIEGILDSLSQEYDQIHDTFNELYLYDKTVEYFKIRSFSILSQELRSAVSGYDAEAGDRILENHNKVQEITCGSVDPFRNQDLIERAFAQSAKPLFRVPGALGEWVSDQMQPEGFITIMGPEKRGKTWWLMQLGMWALRGGCATGFVQAGDMNDEEMTLRMHIHLARRSNKRKYCGELYIPTLDCHFNQIDDCNKRCRTSRYGLANAYETKPKSRGRKQNGNGDDQKAETKPKSPKEIYEENPDYAPCSECYRDDILNFHGAVYWQRRGPCKPLDAQEAKVQGKRTADILKARMEISTHPARSLSVDGLRGVLDIWDRINKFQPKVLVIDYAQILRAAQASRSIREQQMQIATDLRGLAQERKLLIVTGWQADAASYDKDMLGQSNFSETKDILGRVTAMWGLNQNARERRMGLMRINQLVVRSDYFEIDQSVTVLQNLQTGRPYISSFLTR